MHGFQIDVSPCEGSVHPGTPRHALQERFQPLSRPCCNHCLGDRLVCAMTDHVGIRPLSQNHVEGSYDDRLTCSSLSGQDIQASLKVNFKFINESKIFYK